MYKTSLNVLRKLNEAGFSAYIVGGYSRDRFLGLESNDIDICTSAKPEQISCVFDNVKLNNDYGSVQLKVNDFIYEITTYRKDNYTMDGRRNYSISYVSTLDEDLIRRDFLMNTLCINVNGEYVDILGATKSIESKEVSCVKDSFVSFNEDPLRILRAIRFATVLSFKLSDDIISAFPDVVNLLSNLSFDRRKRELDLIFSSDNCMTGINYLKEYKMDVVLGIDLSNVKYSSYYLGIWAQCNYDQNYMFTSKEIKKIEVIRKLLNLKPSINLLYKYGKEVCMLIDEINEDKSYSEMNLSINSRDDIMTSNLIIKKYFPDKLISYVYEQLEDAILNGIITNDKDSIEKYINNLSNNL